MSEAGLWRRLLFLAAVAGALCVSAPACSLANPSLNEQGMPFVQNALSQDLGWGSQNWGVTQDNRDFIYVANNRGVLEYDGVRWRVIMHPRRLRPRSIDSDSTGHVFVAYRGDFGMLWPDSSGYLKFQSLAGEAADSLLAQYDVWHTTATPMGVFFSTEERVYCWRPEGDDPRKGELLSWTLPGRRAVWALAYVQGRLILSQAGVGFWEIRNDELVALETETPTGRHSIVDIVPYGPDTLLATGIDGLYLYDGERMWPFRTPIHDFARTYRGYYCTPMPDGRFALGSHRGGVAIFDRQGRIHQIIDQERGDIPDDFVRGRPFVDNQGGLWVPLNFGISRAEIHSPLRYFDETLGLEGNIHTITRFNGTLYVGTAQGLYKLVPPERAGYPARFVEVHGIETNVRYLEVVQGRMLIGVDQGIYELLPGSNRARFVDDVGDVYVVIGSPDERYVYVGTYRQGLQIVRWTGSGWVHEGRVEGTSGNIRRIHLGPDGELWCRVPGSHLERVDLKQVPGEGVRAAKVTVYDTTKGFPRPASYYPLVLGDRIYAGSTMGLFRYNPETDRFEPDSTLFGPEFMAPEGRWVRYPTLDDRGRIWFEQEGYSEAAAVPRGDGTYEITHPLLRGRNEAYYTFYPETHMVWAGGAGGVLIQYHEGVGRSVNPDYAARIRAVSLLGNGQLFGGAEPPRWDMPVVPYQNNALRFEFAVPRFSASEANRYQFRLLGFQDDWSTWNEETYRDYTGLKEGGYTFEVRGQDVYGHVSEVASFQFRIQPPWYRTAFAYIAYAILGATLLVGVTKLRNRQVEKQKRRLAEQVKDRTRELEDARERIRQHNLELEKLLESRTKELVRTERQAVFGQLVQGIVHNLRSPISVVAGNAQLLEMALRKYMALSEDEDSPDRKRVRQGLDQALGSIQQGATTLDDMVASLMAKSRADSEENQRVLDLNEIIRAELEFLRADPFFKHKVRHEVELTEEPLPVRVVRGEMAQAFENLISNGLDAMHDMDEPVLRVTTVRDGSEAVLTVTDSGTGVPEGIRDRIFDPFFTTKPSVAESTMPTVRAPRGTGLGLWMCRESIQAFGGSVEMESVEGVGTTFIVRLPLADRGGAA